ncbi:2OG-Fe(II) oxygenase family oxidoreductase [Paraphoma chrysanthemicola]|uniref:2OG-Fe(II) oxygenase family oxidoreductase n=1 Tax=Paraphoma chrysanthemicola TaxID=798071 RepID=A0A8K0QS70_9PLEO|nr:2OG-Fe(II) oxygenase family oxidoreductase [Paraphoma chrysanthemicola]
MNSKSDYTTFDDRIADLETVDLGLLARSDPVESQKLLFAAQTKGFFYIELSNPDGRAYLEEAEALLSWFTKFFQKPLPEKLLETSSDEIDYKPIARETGVELGTKDGFEAYKIPTNIFIGTSRVAPPSRGSVDCSSIGQAFAIRSHEISNMIMASLWRSLGLEGGSSFPEQHRFGSLSSSATVMNSYPLQLLPEGSSVGHNAHTDLGSITLLFCSTWGLQVYSAESARWSFVEPFRSRAVVNIGDTLRFMSGNKLKSCLHRVVHHSEWTHGHRLSLAYFARPNSDVKLLDGQGCEWSVEKWVARKFRSYKESHEEQEVNGVQFGNFTGVLTGAMSRSVPA